MEMKRFVTDGVAGTKHVAAICVPDSQREVTINVIQALSSQESVGLQNEFGI